MIYDVEVKKSNGEVIKLSEYKGKTILIVNVASKCGFTKQYDGLQKLYDDYKEKDFVILAFPCNQFGGQEPDTADIVESQCRINFGVNFPIMDKINVNGDDEHPLYTYLKKEKTGLFGSKIKWNFTKFLVDKNGKVIERFAPKTEPESLRKYIEKVL